MSVNDVLTITQNIQIQNQKILCATTGDQHELFAEAVGTILQNICAVLTEVQFRRMMFFLLVDLELQKINKTYGGRIL